MVLGLIALVGPNGAGKTILMRTIATLEKPKEGDITLDGKSIIREPSVMRKLLGYLPQQAAFYPNLTAREFLNYMAAVKGIPHRDVKKQVDELLNFFHLSDTVRKPISAFSGGMKQRVGIATALLGDPEVIIADEPTTGLDPQERVNLRNLLSELALQRIVILSTHIVSDVEAAAGKILILRGGLKIFEGSPENLLIQAEGKVWEASVTENKYIPKGWVISSLTQKGKGIGVRINSGTKPTENAVPVSPNLEDACLAAFSEVAG